MLIHMEDEATLDAIVNDEGIMLAICPECHKIWIGNLVSVDYSIVDKKMESSLPAGVVEIIRSVMDSNPRMLDRIGLTPDIISRLGL